MMNTDKQFDRKTTAAWLQLTLLIILFSLHPAARAADKNSQQPEKLFIEADYMQSNIDSGRSIYSGNVKISHGELVLTGDEVILEQKKEDLESIAVTGKPARYHHVTEKGEPIEAESGQMLYIASQNKLTMTINAKLLQPDHQVSSEKITYDTKNRIVIAGDRSEPSPGGEKIDEKQRVNIILTPKK